MNLSVCVFPYVISLRNVTEACSRDTTVNISISDSAVGWHSLVKLITLQDCSPPVLRGDSVRSAK